jgi:hypothetical protein
MLSACGEEASSGAERSGADDGGVMRGGMRRLGRAKEEAGVGRSRHAMVVWMSALKVCLIDGLRQGTITNSALPSPHMPERDPDTQAPAEYL